MPAAPEQLYRAFRMSARRTSADAGAAGERIAEAYLCQKGCATLCRNYHFGHKEIDLVMRDGDVTVFVEVKARSSSAYGTPAAFVTARKRALLAAAAQAYLQQNDLSDAPARFDVVEVYLSEKRIRHIPNAFGL